jgi:hypothetical protein
MNRFLKEDLNILKKTDPTSRASAQAKKMGLKYVGFGRYEDPKTNQITHVVVNDALTPFKKAVKTNTFRSQQADDLGKYSSLLQPEIEQLHAELVKGYPPEKMDDRELDALHVFTSGGYIDINNRLSSLPAGIPVNKIEPQSMDDPFPDIIDSLDSATKKGRAPFPFMTYVKIGPDYDMNSLKPGTSFRFKGFRTTTLNVVNAISSSENSRIDPNTGRNTAIVLQLNIPKNSKGIYASDFSATPELSEFILHRGARIQIESDFQKLVGSDGATGILNQEIYYADCSVK